MDFRSNGIITLILISFLLCCQNTANAQNLISPEELKKLVDHPNPNHVFLDVRTPVEVSRGVIPGAVHMDFYDESFKKNLNQLDKSKTYYVYCHAVGEAPLPPKFS